MSQALLQPYWVRKVKVLIAQLCVTLFICSPPGSSVHGISQARILEWVAISFSRESSRPRNWTWVSCIAGGFFTVWATRDWITNCIFFLNEITRGHVGAFEMSCTRKKGRWKLDPVLGSVHICRWGFGNHLTSQEYPRRRREIQTESQRTRQASSHKASTTALDILRHRTYQNQVCEIPSIC